MYKQFSNHWNKYIILYYIILHLLMIYYNILIYNILFIHWVYIKILKCREIIISLYINNTYIYLDNKIFFLYLFLKIIIYSSLNNNINWTSKFKHSKKEKIIKTVNNLYFL